MIALEVTRNGKPFCIASTAEVNFVMALLRWVSADADGGEAMDIEVFGQRGNDHLIWRDEPFKVGDVISMRFIDVPDGQFVSKPIHAETLP